MANQNEPSQFRTSVGGQALMEGIMMRGPELIACAVRRPDGSIDLSTEPVRTHWYNKVPMLRGICNMVENLRCGYKYLMHSADISMTEEEAEAEQSAFDHWLEAHVGPKVQDILLGVSAVLGAVMAVANVLGGYLGARLAMKLGSGFVRIVFLVVTGLLALRLAADTVALLT